MSQVSKRLLSKKTQEKMFMLFFQSLANIKQPSGIQEFLFNLLSTTEQIMLAKRLAIAILLVKGYTYEVIKDTLKVSQETIARVSMSLTYRGNGFKKVIRQILIEEKMREFVDTLDAIAISMTPSSSLKSSLISEAKKKRTQKTALG